jgi:hypothetical protein
MARRRMFSLDIIDTDSFMDMPQTSRLLYYELCMRADDDGFVASPKKIMKMVGCNDDDFKILIGKQFIIPFETGIVVIKHWKIHNYIQNDRYKETIYQEEKDQLMQDKNGMYTFCIQDGYTGKVRIGKDSIGKRDRESKKPTLEQIEEYCKSRNNNVNAKAFFDYYEANDWKDKDGKKVKSWKQKVITWETHEKKDDYLSYKERQYLEGQKVLDQYR